MNYNKYCRRCGGVANATRGHNMSSQIYTCPCKDAPLDDSELIAGYRLEARMGQLRAMHELMCNVNDEDIYMSWIDVMPDCPMEEDFLSIACDDEQYNECFDVFVQLIAKKGNRH